VVRSAIWQQNKAFDLELSAREKSLKISLNQSESRSINCLTGGIHAATMCGFQAPTAAEQSGFSGSKEIGQGR
jgi:hypothetical protein